MVYLNSISKIRWNILIKQHGKLAVVTDAVRIGCLVYTADYADDLFLKIFYRLNVHGNISLPNACINHSLSFSKNCWNGFS